MEREPSKKGEASEPTVNDALIEFEVIKTQLYGSGAVDVEPAQLESIRQRMMRGEITPKQAIQEAHEMMAGRQDYH